MNTKFLTLSAAVFLHLSVFSQIMVSTLVGPNSGIEDALAIDKHGNIYGSHFGTPGAGGGVVYKLDTSGNKTAFASGFSSCNGLAFDHQGRLHVVEFGGNVNNSRVYQLDSLGNKTTYGPKIPGASGIVLDPLSDTFFVSQYSSSQGNRISKLSPDGKVSLFCNQPGLNGPVGMAFDHNHNMYVANFNNGNIYRIHNNGDSISLLAAIPFTTNWGIGFLTFASGSLYATGIGVHKVFKISLTGEVSLIAGTGSTGSTNGAGNVAKFNRPNGITTNAAQDRLYVSELITSTVREITGILDVTATHEVENQKLISSLSCFPNPAIHSTQISYEVKEACFTRLQIFSSKGELLQTLVSGPQNKGVYNYQLDTTPLSPGTYVCILMNDENSQSFQFLVTQP